MDHALIEKTAIMPQSAISSPPDVGQQDDVRVLKREHDPENQKMIDRILAHFVKSPYRPKQVFKGRPSAIATEIQAVLDRLLPAEMADEKAFMLDDMVHRLCDFCEESKSGQVAVRMEFMQQQAVALPSIPCQRYSLAVYTSSENQDDKTKRAADEFFSKQVRQFNPAWVGTTTASNDLSAYLALGHQPHLLFEVGSVKLNDLIDQDNTMDGEMPEPEFDPVEIEMLRALSPNLETLPALKEIISSMRGPDGKIAPQSLTELRQIIREVATLQKLSNLAGMQNASPAIKAALRQQIEKVTRLLEKTVLLVGKQPSLPIMRLIQMLAPIVLKTAAKHNAPQTTLDRIELTSLAADKKVLELTVRETLKNVQSLLAAPELDRREKAALTKIAEGLKQELKTLEQTPMTKAALRLTVSDKVLTLLQKITPVLTAASLRLEKSSTNIAPISSTNSIGKLIAATNSSVTRATQSYVHFQAPRLNMPAAQLAQIVALKGQISALVAHFETLSPKQQKSLKEQPAIRSALATATLAMTQLSVSSLARKPIAPVQILALADAVKTSFSAIKPADISVPKTVKPLGGIRTETLSQTIDNIKQSPLARAEFQSRTPSVTLTVNAAILTTEKGVTAPLEPAAPNRAEKMSDAVQINSASGVEKVVIATAMAQAVENVTPEKTAVKADSKVEAAPEKTVESKPETVKAEDGKAKAEEARVDAGCTGGAGCPHCAADFAKVAQDGTNTAPLPENIKPGDDGGLIVMRTDGSSVTYSVEAIAQAEAQMTAAIASLEQQGLIRPDTSAMEEQKILAILSGQEPEKNSVHICDAGCHHNQNVSDISAKAEDAHFISSADDHFIADLNVDDIDFGDTDFGDLSEDYNEAATDHECHSHCDHDQHHDHEHDHKHKAAPKPKAA